MQHKSYLNQWLKCSWIIIIGTNEIRGNNTEWYRSHFTIQTEYYLEIYHTNIARTLTAAKLYQCCQLFSTSQEEIIVEALTDKKISYVRQFFLNTELQKSFAPLCILTNQLFQAITFLSRVHKIPHSNPGRNSIHSDVFHACSQYMEKNACILLHKRPRTILSISYQQTAFRSSHLSKLR
jgi:hypothetical protein